MTDSIDEIARKIVARTIEKSAVLELLKVLSDSDRAALLALIKSRQLTHTTTQDGKPPVYEMVDQRDLSADQLRFIETLVAKLVQRYKKSRTAIAEHQVRFVDQRRAFHLIRDLKKMHFQITYESADGAYVQDLDGNRYIDISGDMGVNIFGHRYQPVVDAIKKSLDRGIPLAGYSEQIFEASKLFSEITGHERVLFTQSGTEAVMFAMRIARAATGKQKIVLFDGSYHGLSDVVFASRDLEGHSVAPAPGLLQEFADQIIILEYGDSDALQTLRDDDDIACVLVEPVQSRFPFRQPVDFLRELRVLTSELDIPLVFDEMITGFRVCPAGAQGRFDIAADMATYGKIVGGGMPTGVIAGSPRYMDLVDGGVWNLDDDSMPKSRRTGMAGTHSQNPLKIAAVHAVLSEIQGRSESGVSCENCHCFQKELNVKTENLASELNTYFRFSGFPIQIDCFGSLFRFRFVGRFWGIVEALFFHLLRLNGVETNIQGNCFLTTAHTEGDIREVVRAVKTSLETLRDENFFFLDTLASEETFATIGVDDEMANDDTNSVSERRPPNVLQIDHQLDMDLAEFQA